jgi:sterol 3beta-glucosyltransferase
MTISRVSVAPYAVSQSNQSWIFFRAFLNAGPEPVYIGFGSMTGRDPEELGRIAVDAAARAGVRAVICSGWGGLGSLASSEQVFALDEVPHGWLFPRVRAVVHHGGAGTLAAGLRAGRPSVVAAFFGDQPYWGEMMEQKGAGPGANRTPSWQAARELLATAFVSTPSPR